MSKVRHYDVSLPIFKKGDDMHHCLETTPSAKEAFLKQAGAYEYCAEACKVLAEFVEKHPEVEIDAQTHWLGLSGPEDLFADLLLQDIVYLAPGFDEEEDGDEDDE